MTTDPQEGGAFNLAQFLEKYPWPVEWRREGKSLDYLWRWDLGLDVRNLWLRLADTSSLNKMLGLPEIQLTEKSGRLHGSFTYLGMLTEWEELPWEWEYGKELYTLRIYSRGIARYFRIRYLLEAVGMDRTRLHVYIGWIPRGLKGRALIAAGMRLMRGRYGAVVNKLADLSPLPDIQSRRQRPALSAQALAELESLREELLRQGSDEVLIGRVLEHVRTASDEELARIRIRPLARKWGTDERKLLSVMLRAARQGAFTLSWDVICPHCRGMLSELPDLGAVPAQASCAACGIDFSTSSLDSLEATFRVRPSIRKPKRILYCVAEPAMKPHILVQRSVPAGRSLTLETLLPPGRYRLRTKGRMDYSRLDAKQDADLERVEWTDDLSQKDLCCRTPPVLVLRNGSVDPATFILEKYAHDEDALRLADLFSFQDFRDLFPGQAVAPDVQLEIGVQTVLFTDLVGSTRFYETVGDAEAFAQIRRHFVKIFEEVRQNSGAVVKTIGDAVMAAFPRPADALRAAVALQRWFSRGNTATPLRVRISLNLGPCLAVRLNSKIDYFGNTVNLASKLQAAAEAHQVVFTESVRGDAEVSGLLSRQGFAPETLDFPLKWSGNNIRIHRITVG